MIRKVVLRFLIGVTGILGLVANGLGQAFSINGNGSDTDDQCIEFHNSGTFSAGTFWTDNTFTFSDTLDILIKLFLGCDNVDGEGFVFALQNIGLSVGSYNGVMGVEGLGPSLIIELDTRQDAVHGDPAFDHIAMSLHGNLDHRSELNLAGPFFAGVNAEDDLDDCEDHFLRIRYEPQARRIRVYFDCVLKIDELLPEGIFPEDKADFHWGGTIGTGGSEVNYLVCPNYTEEIEEKIYPEICKTDSIRLSSTVMGESYMWSPPQAFNDSRISRPWAHPGFSLPYQSIVIDECGHRFRQMHYLQVERLEELILEVDTILCEDESITLNFSGTTDLMLSDGREGNIFILDESGEFFFGSRIPGCPSTSDTIRIEYFSPEAFELGEDTIICRGNRVQLGGPVYANLRVNWQDGSDQPYFIVSDQGTYSVRLQHRCGTLESDIRVSMQDCGSVFIPNAFTPDGDGVNDVFKPLAVTNKIVHSLRIFDRWGAVVHQAYGVQLDEYLGWDGQLNNSLLPSAVYQYVVEMEEPDGSTTLHSGMIHLIR